MATNSTNTTLDIEVGWQAAPLTRGTAAILWNCVTVILLISWTSFYSSVGISKMQRVFTTLTAILVPELSALVALRDFLFAWRLKYCFYDHVRRPGWRAGWTFRQAFLVVKGGIVAEYRHTNSSDDTSPEQTIEVEPGEIIDTETFLRLAVIGSIRFEDFPTTDQISDKSKADWFSKGATLIQLVWFITNMICRVRKGCYISVMEVMTLDWVIFGLVATVLWWACPQNINIPFPVPVHKPSMAAPSPHRDPNTPVGTLLDYIAVYKSAHRKRSSRYNEDDLSTAETRRKWEVEIWGRAEGLLCMVFPLLGHLLVQVNLLIHYKSRWPSDLHCTLWKLFFSINTVAEVALFYLDPHMRVNWGQGHTYYNYILPLMIEAPQSRGSDMKPAGKWLTVAKVMGIYNSTDSKPWRRPTEKTWHEIDLKLLVVSVFIILICQSGKLVIAVMAFKSAPKGIYSVPDVQALEFLAHVGG